MVDCWWRNCLIPLHSIFHWLAGSTAQAAEERSPGEDPWIHSHGSHVSSTETEREERKEREKREKREK